MCVPLRDIWFGKSAVIIIATPLLLLPIPVLYSTAAGSCAYGLLIMAIYWMTEALPIAATALIPIALFPLLGVAPSKDICINYFKDTNVLFLGGLMVAVAVEKWNLHKRIALRVLLLVGSKPKWLMFGFMVTTAFLSMWISNTATTAMMVPIAHSVLTQLKAHNTRKRNKPSVCIQDHQREATVEIDNDELELSSTEPLHKKSCPPSYNTITSRSVPGDDDYDQEDDDDGEIRIVSSAKCDPCTDENFQQMCKGLTLCVCYAANIGGTATLTGTGPNLVLKGQVDTLYGDGASGITFSSWFIFAFPNMIICLGFAWFWLQLMFLGSRQTFSCFYKTKLEFDSTANQVIKREYSKLGPMSFAEKAVLAHFVILALLWISREPEFAPGWAYFFKKGYVTDASISVTVVMFLFMCPSRLPNYWCFRRKSDKEAPGPSVGLLDWQSVHEKLSWGVIIVLGGGFALADACKTSGLSSSISEIFQSFEDVPPWVMVFLLCVITAIFTEVTSNTATTTIFLPIIAELSRSTSVNPLYLMFGVTISASFAFMLPVATPPNAIVFAFGHLKIIDMVKAGVVMNIMCLIILQLALNTWGYAYFQLGEYPSWAGNLTIPSDLSNVTQLDNWNNLTTVMLPTTP